MAKGGDSAFRAFLRESVSDSLIARRGEPRLMGMLATLHQNQQAFIITKVERSEPGVITVLAIGVGEGIPFRVEVDVEPTGRRKITRISLETVDQVERE